LLVSLDFKSHFEKKLLPFLREQQYQSEVILFADLDANTWIPQINGDWDGAIPATLVLKRNKRNFSLGKFPGFPDLEAFILPFLADASIKHNAIDHLVNCASGK
jgi:hypothetical protein